MEVAYIRMWFVMDLVTAWMDLMRWTAVIHKFSVYVNACVYLGGRKLNLKNNVVKAPLKLIVESCTIITQIKESIF